MPTPEEVQSGADEAVRQFSQTLSSQKPSSGIRPPPEITVTEIALDPKKFNIELDRGEDRAESFAGGGGGVGPPPTTCSSINTVAVNTILHGEWLVTDPGFALYCNPSLDFTYSFTWLKDVDFTCSGTTLTFGSKTTNPGSPSGLGCDSDPAYNLTLPCMITPPCTCHPNGPPFIYTTVAVSTSIITVTSDYLVYCYKADCTEFCDMRPGIFYHGSPTPYTDSLPQSGLGSLIGAHVFNFDFMDPGVNDYYWGNSATITVTIA